MNSKQIDWCHGSVTFWDLEFLDPSRSIAEQIDSLKEDLVQVMYLNGIIIDIGWYPEFSISGRFVIRVVNETNWDEPLFLEEQPSIAGLLTSIPKAVQIAAMSQG